MSYDGTNYHGFQTQKNAVTIQETVEKALSEFLKEKVTIYGCGRTDAGVHAKKYFFNFRTNSTVPADRFPFAMKPCLPEDIVFVNSIEENDDFHSRYSIKKKTYVYRIYNSNVQNPFERNYSYFYPQKLDFEKMQNACEVIIGKHDFRAFMASGGQVKTTVRTVFDLHLEKSGNVISVFVTADGFLYNMVRIITGTLIDVGNGKITKEDIQNAILNNDRKKLGVTVPPQGLFMYDIEY